MLPAADLGADVDNVECKNGILPSLTLPLPLILHALPFLPTLPAVFLVFPPLLPIFLQSPLSALSQHPAT